MSGTNCTSNTDMPNEHRSKFLLRGSLNTATTVTVWTISGILLAACTGRPIRYIGSGNGTDIGGDGSNIDGGNSEDAFSFLSKITVRDGPVVGAEVWVDVDGDGGIDSDAGDVFLGITDENGQVDFPQEYHGMAILVDVSEAVDLDHPDETLSGTWRSLPSDTDSFVLVTPITNLLAENEGTDAQDILDSIFGVASDGSSIIEISDILNPENYTLFSTRLDAELITRAAVALARLQTDDTLTNEGDETTDTLLEKLQTLFEEWRDVRTDDDPANDEFDDDLLIEGTLKDAIVSSISDTENSSAQPPVFSDETPTTGSIAENTDGSGTAVSIVTVTATDPDGDTVVYTLDPASIRQGFEIHAGTGAITYTGTGDDLDHETTASYTLTVTASSAGGSDTHTVTVTVTDVNEAPVFAGNTPTTGTLAEHVDGSSTAVDIVTVTASDPEGDTIAYSLDASSVSRGFAIHASTGAITYTGTGLDHESAETYALTVTATSSGGTASHIVTVTVSNIDEAPAFVANAPATASIHENRDGSSTAVAITTVTATDPDGDTVIYTLDPASIRNHFEINASTGAIIYTGTGLDRETTASYTLTVTATSSGGTDTHTVTVSVVDANESLAFDSGTPTTASLAENADGSSSAVGVVTVTATDPDGDTVTYSLVTPPAGFTINASSGAITYTGTGLDHETADSLTLTIRATSSGGTATHTVTVTVTDVNEAPLLALMAAQSVTDTTATDAFADLTGTFTATDADDGDTAFTFTVTGATANSTEAGFTHAVSNTYGTLFYNSTTGVWKFVVDAAASQRTGCWGCATGHLLCYGKG